MNLYLICGEYVFSEDNFTNHLPVLSGEFTNEEIKYIKDVANGKIVIDIDRKTDDILAEQENQRQIHNEETMQRIISLESSAFRAVRSTILSMSKGEKPLSEDTDTLSKIETQIQEERSNLR